jgi:hypothetical protein
MEQSIPVEDVNLQLDKYQRKVCMTFFSVTVWNNIDTTKNLKNAQSANLEIFVVAVRQSLNVYPVTFMVKILNVGKQLNNMSKPVLIFSKRVLLFFF